MIHRYKMSGLNIVFDSSAGKGHLVDEIAYDIIGLFDTQDEEEIIRTMTERHGWRAGVDETDIEDCYERIRELKENGHLFVPDEDGAAPEKMDGSLTLLMEDGGAAMDFDTGCRALNQLMECSGKGACLSVEFRCGSPEENAEVTERLIGYARREGRMRGRAFLFLRTVNGVLTDEWMAGSTGRSVIREIRRAERGGAVRIYGGKNDFPLASIDAGRLRELNNLMEADDDLFCERLNGLIRRDGGTVFAFYHYVVDLQQERIITVAPGGNLSAGSDCGLSIGNVWDGAEWDDRQSVLPEEKMERRILLEMLGVLTDISV